MHRAARAKERRELWRAKTKNLILVTLKKIEEDEQIKTMKQNALSARENSFAGAESVCLEFLADMIDTVTGKGADTGLFRRGGYLCYSLRGNGKILVWHSFPFVEEKEQQPPHRLLHTLEPEEITEHSIYDHVAQFLTNINSRDVEAREPFGFATWKRDPEA